MKRIYYICNLQAGKATISSKIGSIIDMMTKAGYEVTVHPTQASFDAVLCTTAAAESGLYEYIFCSGGDGTLNEVMCGMMNAAHKIPIGYIPSGSTNDFARSIGIPRGALKAAQSVLGGVPRRFDIGMVNTRSFNYIAAFGAFTDVTYETPQSAKNMFGQAAYLFSSMKKLTNIRAFPMRITCDGGVYEGDFAFGMITNTASVGGVVNISDFRFDDGLFEVTLLKRPETPAELQKTITFLKDIHEMENTDKILTFRAADITIELLDTVHVPWTIDGEYMESAAKLHIVNHKQAVSLLVPTEHSRTGFSAISPHQ
ncbi:MAG: diacylglycerol kinase family lipid kinase [Ruminococcus sp.]|jgi:YegS/Rv2252/BmrU family lipid kinase|nr:diacylglycerol kinase family lipid kinase [Ruminococcus sp.]